MIKNLATIMITVALVTTACGSDRKEDNRIAAIRSQLEGSWKLVKVDSTLGKDGSFKLNKRQIDIHSDGTFHIENTHSSEQFQWKLQGKTILLTINSTSPTKSHTTRNKNKKYPEIQRIKVEKVTRDTLILIEEVPKVDLGGDTDMAGPYSLQGEIHGSDKGKPWLFLGISPGLKVQSLHKKRGTSPRVIFSTKK